MNGPQSADLEAGGPGDGWLGRGKLDDGSESANFGLGGLVKFVICLCLCLCLCL